jgi:hypothetical protein
MRSIHVLMFLADVNASNSWSVVVDEIGLLRQISQTRASTARAASADNQRVRSASVGHTALRRVPAAGASVPCRRFRTAGVSTPARTLPLNPDPGGSMNMSIWVLPAVTHKPSQRGTELTVCSSHPLPGRANTCSVRRTSRMLWAAARLESRPVPASERSRLREDFGRHNGDRDNHDDASRSFPEIHRKLPAFR